jgi:hypothetical protein
MLGSAAEWKRVHVLGSAAEWKWGCRGEGGGAERGCQKLTIGNTAHAV